MVRRVKPRLSAWVAIVALPLALGALSYVVLRSWIPLLGAHAALWPGAPRALRDHFADAMWGVSLGGFVSLVWADGSRAHRLAWVGVAALAAAGVELLQFGSFDWADLVVQTGGVLIAAWIIGGTKRWTWASETR